MGVFILPVAAGEVIQQSQPETIPQLSTSAHGRLTKLGILSPEECPLCKL